MEALLVSIDKHDYAQALLQIDSLIRTAKDPLFPVYLNFMRAFIQYYASIPAALSTLSSVLVGITPAILQYNMGNLLHFSRGAGLDEYIAMRVPSDINLTSESFPHLCRYKLVCRDYAGIEKFIIVLNKQSNASLSKDHLLRPMLWKEALAFMVARSQISLLLESASAQTILTKNARTLFKLALSGFLKNFLPNMQLFDKTVPRSDTVFLESLHRQSPISILTNLIEYDIFLAIATGVDDQGRLPEFIFNLEQLRDVSFGATMDPSQHIFLCNHKVLESRATNTPEVVADTNAEVSTSDVKTDSLLLKVHMTHPRAIVIHSLLTRLQRMSPNVPSRSLWNLVYADFWALFIKHGVTDALDICKIMSLDFRVQLDLIYFLRDGKEAALARLNSLEDASSEFVQHQSVFVGKNAYISVSKISVDVLLKILAILSRTTYNSPDITYYGLPEKLKDGPLLLLQRDVNAAIKHIIRTIFDRILSGSLPLFTLIEVSKIVQELRYTEYGFELKNLASIVIYVWNKEKQYSENHVLTVFAMYIDMVRKYTEFRWYLRRNGSLVLPSDRNMQMRDISFQNKNVSKKDDRESRDCDRMAQEICLEYFSLSALQRHMDTVATAISDLLYRGRNFNVATDDVIISFIVSMIISLLNLFQNPYFHEYTMKSQERCKTPRSGSANTITVKASREDQKKSSESSRSGSPFTSLIFKKQLNTEADTSCTGAVARHVSLSNECFRSIDRAFSALIDMTNNLYEHLHEIFCSQKGLADAYPNTVVNLLLLKQRMRTLNVETWKSSLEEEVLYEFFDLANQQYQVFGSFSWRWFLERGIVTRKPAHTVVSGIADMAVEDKRWIAGPGASSDKSSRNRSTQSRRISQKAIGDAPLGTCMNPLCFPGQFLHVRRAAQCSAATFGFIPLIQGAAQYGREFITTAYQSVGSSMLELIHPCFSFDLLSSCARMQVSAAYIFSDSLEVIYKWMGVCLGYRNLKKTNLIGLFIGLTGILAGTGEPYLRYTRHKNYLIDFLDINGFAVSRHLFDDGGYLRDESLGAARCCSGEIPDTAFFSPANASFDTPSVDVYSLEAGTVLPLSPVILQSNLWEHYLSTQPSLAAKSLTLNPGLLAFKIPKVLSQHTSFSRLLNHSIALFLRGRDSIFARRLPRSDAIAVFLIYHICSHIYLLMNDVESTVIELSRSEITTVFHDMERLIQAKVSPDYGLASKAHSEFFDYHGFTQRLPPLDLLFNISLLKYWLERLGALTVTLPIASEVVIRSCDLALTIPLITLIASAIIFRERGLMDDVQLNIDALIECITRKTVDSSVEPTRQLCLACLHNILRFQI